MPNRIRRSHRCFCMQASGTFLETCGFYGCLATVWKTPLDQCYSPSFYLVCGIGGDLLHYAFNATSTVPCVGASGAISGILGCFFVLFPKANFDLLITFRWSTLKTIHTHTHAAIGAWIGEQTLLGLITQALHASSVAFWAHVGGFAVGLAAGGIAVLIFPRKKLQALDHGKPWFQRDRFNRDRDDFIQLKL